MSADVAERIRQFNEKHPDGSLQSEIQPVHRADGELVGSSFLVTLAGIALYVYVIFSIVWGVV